MNSVPQPEHHNRRQILPVDSASTRISSLLQGKSGKRSLWSTGHLRRNCVPLNDPARSGRWGKATPYRTGAERAPIVANFSYSVSGRFRLFAIRNDSISGIDPGRAWVNGKRKGLSRFLQHDNIRDAIRWMIDRLTSVARDILLV